MRLSTVIMVAAISITLGGTWLIAQKLKGSPLIAVGLGASMVAGYQRHQEDN
jgi:hypothetical protein